jgi:hypothetical protein
VINKPVVKKSIIAYMKKCFSESVEENNLDIDDMIYDSLKEQAENLDLLKYVQGDEYLAPQEEAENEEIPQKRK